MSDLSVQLSQDIKIAMKAGEADKVTALRMLSAAIKQIEVDTNIAPTEEAVVSIFRKELKKRQDSFIQYTEANRTDLADKEAFEIKLIEQYLPALMSDDQVKEKVSSLLQAQGLIEKKDFGKAMGIVMKELGNQADGNTVKQAVNECLK